MLYTGKFYIKLLAMSQWEGIKTIAFHIQVLWKITRLYDILTEFVHYILDRNDGKSDLNFTIDLITKVK